MSFPRQLQFEHGGSTYNAVLVDGNASSAATGQCCICGQLLGGRPHYATNHAQLVRLHTDCALQHRSRSLLIPFHHHPHRQGFINYPQMMPYAGAGGGGHLPQQYYHPPPWPYQYYYPPPWPYQYNYIHGHGGHHYPGNNIPPPAGSWSVVAGAIERTALAAFLQALFGWMLDDVQI